MSCWILNISSGKYSTAPLANLFFRVSGNGFQNCTHFSRDGDEADQTVGSQFFFLALLVGRDDIFFLPVLRTLLGHHDLSKVMMLPPNDLSICGHAPSDPVDLVWTINIIFSGMEAVISLLTSQMDFLLAWFKI